MDVFAIYPILNVDLISSDVVKQCSDLYTQLPAGHIRLLRIQDVGVNGEVFCEIKTFKLVQGLHFTALSYTWGSALADCSVYINSSEIRIRKNLWRFLRHAYQSALHGQTWYWIDALCINQANLRERTHQVNLMADIYTKADSVLIWLGPAHHDSDRVMKHLARTSTLLHTSKSFARLFNGEVGLGLQHFCTRAYWSRLWIFQELMLANRIDMMCGSWIVPFERLTSLLSSLSSTTLGHRITSLVHYEHVRFSPTTSIVEQVTARSKDLILWDLIMSTQHLHCAEQRDKIFALLGVARAGHDGLTPDYELPVPSLLNLVLKAQYELHPPSTLEEVELHCKQLTAAMGVDIETMFLLEGQRGQFSAPSETETTSLPLRWGDGPFTLWWTEFYDHEVVSDMIADQAHLTQTEGELLAFPSSLLNTAAHIGSETGMGILLDVLELSPNCRDVVYDYATPLEIAIEKNHTEIVKLLLDCEDLNVDSKYSTAKRGTPIELAVSQGRGQILGLLLTHGRFDPLISVGPSGPPLHMAAKMGSTEMVTRLLYHKNTDVNATQKGNLIYGGRELRNSEGCTPLHMAAAGGFGDVVSVLLRRDAIEVNALDRFDRTPLYIAAYNGHMEVVTQLLHHPKIDITRTTREHESILHAAVSSEALDVVQLLLFSDRIDVNAIQGTWTSTPLYQAISSGNRAIAMLLLADPRVDCNACWSAGGPAPIHAAARRGYADLVRYLLAKDSTDVNAQLRNTETPCHLAIRSGSLETVQCLMDCDRTWTKCTDRFGNSLLHFAASIGRHEMIDYIASKMPSGINGTGSSQASPLHLAVHSNHLAVVQHLLALKSIDVNARDVNYRTPLHYAVFMNRPEMVQCLLEHRQIQINCEDRLGRTPYYIVSGAKSDEGRRVIALLRAHPGLLPHIMPKLSTQVPQSSPSTYTQQLSNLGGYLTPYVPRGLIGATTTRREKKLVTPSWPPFDMSWPATELKRATRCPICHDHPNFSGQCNISGHVLL